MCVETVYCIETNMVDEFRVILHIIKFLILECSHGT